MRKLFFVGVLLASLFCGTSALLAKEDGTEECSPIPIETCLEQARSIAELGENFLQTLRDGIVEVKEAEVLIKGLINETFNEAFSKYPILAEDKEEYYDSIRRYWAKSGQPAPK